MLSPAIFNFYGRCILQQAESKSLRGSQGSCRATAKKRSCASILKFVTWTSGPPLLLWNFERFLFWWVWADYGRPLVGCGHLDPPLAGSANLPKNDRRAGPAPAGRTHGSVLPQGTSFSCTRMPLGEGVERSKGDEERQSFTDW